MSRIRIGISSLGPAPKRPFDLHRYYQWRLYWDYSGGISTDLLVHQTDIVNFVCGKTLPSSCMASGGIIAGPLKTTIAMCPIR